MPEQIGPYQILEELGRGAMGVVFRGLDPSIGRPVAIKVIRTQAFSTADENAEARLRFTREASAAGRLSHPNIVTVHQLGEERDFQYLVMELVPGSSLEKLLDAGTPMNTGRVMSILPPIADALDHAHSEGVVHRDIKPANILVRPDGKVKITDFGIARVVSQTLTKTGMTTGTPAYMSPEQIMSSKVDGKADQFSLAVMAYEMLSGRKPFEADAPHTLMMQIMNDEPEPIHRVNLALPRECSAVFAKALAKKAGERYPTCSEFVQALAGTLEGNRSPSSVPDFARQIPSPSPLPTPIGVSKNLHLIVIGALVACSLAAGALFIWRGRTAEVPSVATTNVPTNSLKKVEVKNSEVSSVPGATVPNTVPDSRPKNDDLKATEVRPVPVATVPASLPRKHLARTNPKDGLRYVWIAPGSFQMGCSPGDKECGKKDEKPSKQVTLTQGYWLGETEVTQAAFENVIGNNPSYFRGSDLPVENVNWNQAKSYCETIGGRLPTEAEWEYAARGGNTSSRYGDVDQVGWYDKNSGGKTHAVRGKRANSNGLYDMLGNVWEWTADRYTEKLSGGTDPTGPTNGGSRVLRGGSWYGNSTNLRAAYRLWNDPTILVHIIGFRCAWE